nr:hypothetical protein BaRGS_000932 [Batillaria attramentaria]
MIFFLVDHQLEVNDLSSAEILAASRGYRLRKAKIEVSEVKDPWKRKALADPKRNKFIKKVIFDTGPNENQKLLLAVSDDFILVYDCDRECVCHWFLRRPRRQAKSRQDYYILSQVDIGADVGLQRFQRQCKDLNLQLRILRGLVSQYAKYGW